MWSGLAAGHRCQLTYRSQSATVMSAIYYGGVALTPEKQNEYNKKQLVLLGKLILAFLPTFPPPVPPPNPTRHSPSLPSPRNRLTIRRTADKHPHPTR